MKVRLPIDWDRDLQWNSSLSIYGLSQEVPLIERCYCVLNDCDRDTDEAYETALSTCCYCKGKGIKTTDNGEAILALIKFAGD